MANTSSAKGNPASKRMMNPNNKAKRQRNLAKNERLKANGQHPKQIKAAKDKKRALDNDRLIFDFGIPRVSGQVRKQAQFIREAQDLGMSRHQISLEGRKVAEKIFENRQKQVRAA